MSWKKISNFLGGKLYLCDSIPKNTFGEHNDKALKLNDYSLYLFQNNGWVKQGYISEKPRQLNYFENNKISSSYIKNKPILLETLELIDNIGDSIQELQKNKQYYIDLSETITQNQIMITASKANEEKNYIDIPTVTKNQAGLITSTLYNFYLELTENLNTENIPNFQGIYDIINGENIDNILNENLNNNDIFLLKLNLKTSYVNTFNINFLNMYDKITIFNEEYMKEKNGWFLCQITLNDNGVSFTVNNKNLIIDIPKIVSDKNKGIIFSSDKNLELNVNENGVAKINNLAKLNNKLITITNPTLQHIQEFSFDDLESIWNKYGKSIKNIYGGKSVNDSYIETTNGIIIYFNSINTPINNFCNRNDEIIINKYTFNKSEIKIISFGNSYYNTTSIPENFLFTKWNNLINVNLQGLSNVTECKNYFITSIMETLDLSPLSNITYIPQVFCTGLKYLDLSVFSNIQRIDTNQHNNNNIKKLNLKNLKNLRYISTFFYYNCPNLKEIYIDNKNWELVDVDDWLDEIIFGGTTPNNSDCKIYAPSLSKGNDFKIKFNNLSNWSVVIE